MRRTDSGAFMLFVRKLHKWLSLIVGVQILLWTLSGLVFAWVDHHEVSAEHSVRDIEPEPVNLQSPVPEPSVWLAGSTGSIYDIGLTTLVGQPVWRVETSQGVTLHALDGAPLVLGESLVRELASRRYAGPGALTSLSFEAGPTLEARGAGAVWRAEFDDPERTTLYFSSDDGRLVAARNDTWRLFDWFWMFHTMDYRGRDNFNNPVVIAVGTAALWLVLSGFLLLFRSFRREDFAS